MLLDRDYDNFVSISVGVNGKDMDIGIFVQHQVDGKKKMFTTRKVSYNVTYSDIMKFFTSDVFRDKIMENIRKTINNK